MNDKLIENIVGGPRFTIVGGYRFDKLIFGICILSLMLLFVIIFIANGSDKGVHTYYSCNPAKQVGSFNSTCPNPFFMNYPSCLNMWAGACEQERVIPGFEFGLKPPLIINWWGYLVLLWLCLAFLVNHFVYNKGFKRVASE